MNPNLNRGRKGGKTRPYEQAARTRAFSAARLAISDNLPLSAAAERAGSVRSTAQEAFTILQFGTAEEILAAEAGTMSLRGICDEIRRRIPEEERRAKARKPVYAPRVKDTREFEAEVWANIKTALDALTSLPIPSDVIAIVKKNAQRSETVSRKALTAHTWLEEFVNAWTE